MIDIRSFSFKSKGLFGMSAYRLKAPWGGQIWRNFFMKFNIFFRYEYQTSLYQLTKTHINHIFIAWVLILMRQINPFIYASYIYSFVRSYVLQFTFVFWFIHSYNLFLQNKHIIVRILFIWNFRVVNIGQFYIAYLSVLTYLRGRWLYRLYFATFYKVYGIKHFSNKTL